MSVSFKTGLPSFSRTWSGVMPSLAPRKSVYSGCCTTGSAEAARAFWACTVALKIKPAIAMTTRAVRYRFILVCLLKFHVSGPTVSEGQYGHPDRKLPLLTRGLLTRSLKHSHLRQAACPRPTLHRRPGPATQSDRAVLAVDHTSYSRSVNRRPRDDTGRSGSAVRCRNRLNIQGARTCGCRRGIGRRPCAPARPDCWLWDN